MKKVFLLASAFLLLISSGCSTVGDLSRSLSKPEQEFQELGKSRTVTVSDEPYLGAQRISRQEYVPAALETRVTLRQRGSIHELAAKLGEMLPIQFQVASGTESRPAPSGKQKAPDPELLAALDTDLPMPRMFSVSYEGTLHGLLEQIAVRSGYSWEYDDKANTVLFSAMQVRTFTIMSVPGTVQHSNLITNKSNRGNSSSFSGSGIGSTVSNNDTQMETAQVNSVEWKFDVWDECMEGVKMLLSSQGAVSGNQAAGTITVREKPDRMREVASYIRDINSRMERQVALTVYVWSLELTEGNEAGFNLQALFENSSVSVVAGSLSSFGGSNSATATIVDGRLRDSSAALKALAQWGKVTEVTSGGGVLMNNQPLPSQAIQTHAYLAGMSRTESSSENYTSELTPGEVTTGFAMTVIPHILDRRRVILQYNINLAKLDEMLELSNDDTTIQLPQVSRRSFSQRTKMKMGQTLVLAGFAQESQNNTNSAGIFSALRNRDYSKTLLIITIQLESAEV